MFKILWIYLHTCGWFHDLFKGTRKDGRTQLPSRNEKAHRLGRQCRGRRIPQSLVKTHTSKNGYIWRLKKLVVEEQNVTEVWVRDKEPNEPKEPNEGQGRGQDSSGYWTASSDNPWQICSSSISDRAQWQFTFSMNKNAINLAKTSMLVRQALCCNGDCSDWADEK